MCAWHAGGSCEHHKQKPTRSRAAAGTKLFKGALRWLGGPATALTTQAKSSSATAMSVPITLGGGCFWCLDAVYRQLKGIQQSVSGYAAGDVPNPTYKQVSNGAAQPWPLLKNIMSPVSRD